MSFDKVRIEYICTYCRIHTKQYWRIGGWKCSVCGRLLKKNEAVKFVYVPEANDKPKDTGNG